jgi:hypothetical protein
VEPDVVDPSVGAPVVIGVWAQVAPDVVALVAPGVVGQQQQ